MIDMREGDSSVFSVSHRSFMNHKRGSEHNELAYVDMFELR